MEHKAGLNKDITVSYPRFCRHIAHLFSRLAVTTHWSLGDCGSSFEELLPPLPHNFPFLWQALGRSVASMRGQRWKSFFQKSDVTEKISIMKPLTSFQEIELSPFQMATSQNNQLFCPQCQSSKHHFSDSKRSSN